MTDEEKQFYRELKKMTATEMFSVLEQLLIRILTKEITVPSKSPDQVQQLIDDMNKKVQSKHYESMFHCFRARIEQMIDEGYTVQPITKEDKQKKLEM